MALSGVDLVVIGPTSNLRYLTGYQAMAVDRITALLVSRTDAVMLLPDFDMPEFVEVTGCTRIVGWSDRDGPAMAVETAFRSLRGTEATAPTVAIDEYLPFLFFNELRPCLGPGPYRMAGELLGSLRLRKSVREQEAIAATARLVSDCIDLAMSLARPGTTERELQRQIRSVLEAGGAESTEFVLVQAGPHTASCHHRADETELRVGEPVLIDIAVSVNGYYADITQQVFLGPPPPDYLHVYDVVAAAQQAAVDAAQPGGTVGAVDRAASRIIGDAGFGEWADSRTGHGLGLDVHEAPSVVEGNTMELVPGVVITIEPGIYLPGRFGVRIEDTVLVSESGPVRLTRGARPLAVADCHAYTEGIS